MTQDRAFATRDTFLPFARPSITDDDVAAVGEVLKSGWITTGPHARAFEGEFAAYVGLPEGHTVALSSATAGMHLVLVALGIGPGDEVITPSMTWVSTANQIVLAGASPVWVDVDRDTLMVRPESVEAAITTRTRAIVPVHYAGAPCDLDPLRKMAADRGIPLIEDAAHAAGASYKDEKVGRRGTSIFSFHPIKNVTSGEGGMFCSEDEELIHRVQRLKFHGLGVDAHDRRTQGRAPQAEVLEPGFKYNLTDIAAVLGRRQLARLDGWNARRGELTGRYRRKLADVEEVRPLSDPDYAHDHARHLFIVRLDPERAGMERDTFMEELAKRNIGTGLHFRAVHLQQYYMEKMGTKRGMLPESEWNSDRICSLPLFPGMTKDDVDDVVAAIRDVLGGGR